MSKEKKINSFEGLYQIVKVDELLKNQKMPEKEIKKILKKEIAIGQEVVVCSKKEWINGLIGTVQSFRKDGKVIIMSGGGTKYLCDVKHLKHI